MTRKLLIALALLAALGCNDWEDAALSAARCEQMVNDGVWPAEVCD